MPVTPFAGITLFVGLTNSDIICGSFSDRVGNSTRKRGISNIQQGISNDEWNTEYKKHIKRHL